MTRTNRSSGIFFTKSAARVIAAAIFSLLLIPVPSWACACGCGIFDVGSSEMFPIKSGGAVFLEIDHMNQNRNWSGSGPADHIDNDDKRILSTFYTAGLQYMFNRSWGVEVHLPYTDRDFTTTDESSGDIVPFHHSNFGDIRLMGIYSGFSPDMSTGIRFGVKLPNGDYTFKGFDRDTSIGTGSTDMLLGAYHMDRLTKDNRYSWFVQGLWDQPLLTRNDYRPGSEIDVALGTYYEGWKVGHTAKVAPVLQLIGSTRQRDSGTEANPNNSGYNRLLFAPGAEFKFESFKVYGDVEMPVYQHVNGNQLVASELFKLTVSYDF